MATHKHSRAAKHLAAKHEAKKSKKSGHKVHHVHIRRSSNGGYIVENHHEADNPLSPAPPMEEHTYPDLAGVQQHLEEHLPQETEQGQEGQEQQAPEEESAGPVTPGAEAGAGSPAGEAV